jgi:hypothetical protein
MRKLTQEQLAAQAASRGWDMSRITLAKIEAQLRYVSDVEVVFFASLLKVPYQELLPRIEKGAFLPSFDRKEAHHLKGRGSRDAFRSP